MIGGCLFPRGQFFFAFFRDVVKYLLDRYICIAYTVVMIKSFGDAETEKVWNEIRSKKLPPEIQQRGLSKLLVLNSVVSEDDLKSPPSNHFEHLKGKLKEFCSIRINQQWRIVFKFENGHASEVSIVDYH